MFTASFNVGLSPSAGGMAKLLSLETRRGKPSTGLGVGSDGVAKPGDMKCKEHIALGKRTHAPAGWIKPTWRHTFAHNGSAA